MGRKPSISSVLTLYLQDVKKVRRNGMKLKLSEHEVNQLMEEYILSLLMDGKTKQINNESGFRMLLFIKSVFSFLKTIIVIIFGCLVSVLTIYIVLQHKPTQYFVQSKLQDFIYPCMKILRFSFLPIITMYPSLTNLYDESCLVVNPLFRVPDMLCPCEDVRAILNVTGEDPRQEQYHSGIPFMVKVDREEISWRKLKSLYKNYSTVFDRDASHLLISTSSHKNKKSSPAVVFNTDFSVNDSLWDHTHIKWRCNRMEPTRLLRSIFGRPDSEPYYAAGVTIEKLVMVDGPRAPLYHLPTTDGTSVFIQQSSGSRLIVLSPADECKEKCTSVSVELPPGHILWFSWWYWRASSLPSPAMETLSISYIGSYL